MTGGGMAGGLGVEITDNDPQCMLCLGPGLLQVKFRQTLPGSLGAEVGGSMIKTLCPACDADVPQAAQLIALFTVDGQVGVENQDLFGRLLREWVDYLSTLSVDLVQLDREIEQWENGEL